MTFYDKIADERSDLTISRPEQVLLMRENQSSLTLTVKTNLRPELLSNHRLSDLGLIPDKYALACSVISRLGLVFPQAIMFHLTST